MACIAFPISAGAWASIIIIIIDLGFFEQLALYRGLFHFVVDMDVILLEIFVFHPWDLVSIITFD